MAAIGSDLGAAEHHVSTLGSHDANSPFRHPLRWSGTSHGRHVEETEDDSFSSVGSQQPLLDASSDVQKGPSLELEDVGLPSDGARDHEAAYRHRFGFDHGQLEYLLGVADRWMYTEDLELCNAEEALGTMLQSAPRKTCQISPPTHDSVRLNVEVLSPRTYSRSSMHAQKATVCCTWFEESL